MERRVGEVIRDDVPESMAGHDDVGRRMSIALVDAMAELHLLDPADADLTTLGRPDGFVERQVSGWQTRWDLVRPGRRSAGDGHRCRAARGRLPAPTRVSFVHNDLKLDNCQFDPRRPGPGAVDLRLGHDDARRAADRPRHAAQLLARPVGPAGCRPGQPPGLLAMGLPTRAEILGATPSAPASTRRRRTGTRRSPSGRPGSSSSSCTGGGSSARAPIPRMETIADRLPLLAATASRPARRARPEPVRERRRPSRANAVTSRCPRPAGRRWTATEADALLTTRSQAGGSAAEASMHRSDAPCTSATMPASPARASQPADRLDCTGRRGPCTQLDAMLGQPSAERDGRGARSSMGVERHRPHQTTMASIRPARTSRCTARLARRPCERRHGMRRPTTDVDGGPGARLGRTARPRARRSTTARDRRTAPGRTCRAHPVCTRDASVSRGQPAPRVPSSSAPPCAAGCGLVIAADHRRALRLIAIAPRAGRPARPAVSRSSSPGCRAPAR